MPCFAGAGVLDSALKATFRDAEGGIPYKLTAIVNMLRLYI